MKSSSIPRITRPIVLVALLAAVIMLGHSNSAWATPLQAPAGQSVPTATPGGPARVAVTPPPSSSEGERQQIVAPGVAATVDLESASVVLPANSLSAAGTVAVRSLASDQLPPAGAGFALLGKAIEVTLFDAQGQQLVHPSFANPVQVCFGYTADDLAQVGGDTDTLVVQFYDVSTAKWIALPTKVDAVTGQACGSVTHFTTFSLAARSATSGLTLHTNAANLPSSLPNTGDAAGMPGWIGAISVLAMIVGAAMLVRSRQPKRTSR